MFVISFNICLFVYFSVKYAIQSNDCDVFVNKQSIYLSSIYLSMGFELNCRSFLPCKNLKIQMRSNDCHLIFIMVVLFPLIPMFDNSRFPVNISGSMFDFTRTQT